MVGHGEGKRQRALGVAQVGVGHAAVEGLAEAVGGDEAEAAQARVRLGIVAARELRGLVPPVHDEIRRFRHLGVGFAHGLRIAVAEIVAHAAGPEKGRVADDEVGLRPPGGHGVGVVVDGQAGGLIRHVLARAGVAAGGHAVIAGDGIAVRVAADAAGLVRQKGVAVADVLGVPQNGRGPFRCPHRAVALLQVADPQHEFGDLCGPRVEFDAEELGRVHLHEIAEALIPPFPKGRHEVEDFGFQLLHHFQRDIEEIARAAGGVEHAGAAEAVVEGAQEVEGVVVAPVRVELVGAGAHGVELRAQGLDQGGHDEAFHIGAGREVRAVFAPRLGVERVFDQRAEDGGLDLRPVALGGADEAGALHGVDGQRLDGGEQAAIYAQDLLAEAGGHAADIHLGEKLFEDFAGDFRIIVVALALEEVGEAVLWQDADVFGEHGEDALHQKARGHFGRRALFAVGARDGGEFVGDLLADFCGLLGAVEAVGVEPDGAQALAHVRVAEVFEREPRLARVGKQGVIAAAPGKVGEDFELVADVGDDHERRSGARFGLDVAGIGAGLGQRLVHGAPPRLGAANAVARGGGGLRDLARDQRVLPGVGGSFLSVHALFGFEHKGARAVEVDVFGGAAIGVFDGALEHIGVALGDLGGGVGMRHVEQVAELDQEALVVGALRRGGGAPARDKVVDVHGRPPAMISF